MKIKIACIILPSLFSAASYAEQEISDRMVECDGNTLIKVNDRIGAQTPFHAMFKISGNTVTMTEGDFMRFSKDYTANAELSIEGRSGYTSENGNLFFYKESGRFEIAKIGVVSSGLKTEETSGQCKKFTPSDAFN
ncbi:MAG: hypothetical protein GY695_04335 [Aestuariibacter sp.]|jgi:hypothetical protein|uniref:hypothetical protein n=1 Tax=Marisediminitalea aggregata TaxID=634436 RepID=UPI0020CEBF2C|nr:hypothetical protein [Marisediminitalea aggregata]MCP3685875.1 hypothetical protein [bacterium]MCP3862361.1 hypothetical protein [Aestuariibacter sp.]MCP4057492.1 hypothetical protein [Pseudoalteromonas sp.]MCP9479842.1 hypothetical protein [Marisediminitalea aggregata]